MGEPVSVVSEALPPDAGEATGLEFCHPLKKHPSLAALILGGLTVAAASALGVGEFAMGLAVGYGAYQVLRNGKSVTAAVHEVMDVVRESEGVE